MKTLTALKIILFFLSMFLLISVDWKIALGVVLFGWMMNIENATRA